MADAPFEDTEEFLEEICVLKNADGGYVIAGEDMLADRSKELMLMEVGSKFTVAVYRLKTVKTVAKQRKTPLQ